MSSVRMWLGSGSVLAGVGAAMLCSAGMAAADTGGDRGSDNPSTHVAPASSSAPQRGAQRSADARPGAAAAVAPASRAASPAKASRAASTPAATIPAIPDTRVVPFAASVPAAAAVSAVPVVQPKAAATKAAAVPVVPSQAPVDPAKFAGTYYEQGSVKQFFSIGLVNTKAVYTLNPDGTIRVQNSGNYFFNRGPKSSIVGSAVPVNADNTALNVGFGPFNNSAKPPGNYTILAYAPDYNWVIVSDPTGKTGYILTRSKTIPAQDYQQFVAQARSLGVTGRITPTRQYPA